MYFRLIDCRCSLQLTEMELRHVAMLRAAERTEHHVIQHHQHQRHLATAAVPPPPPPAEFHPSTIRHGLHHPTASPGLPLSAANHRLAPAVPPPSPSPTTPPLRPVVLAPPAAEPRHLDRPPSPDRPIPPSPAENVADVRIAPLPETTTRLPASTGSRSTTKCHVTGFSIDSLLGGGPQGDRKASSERLEVRKFVADHQDLADSGTRLRHGDGQTPVSMATVPRAIPGCTARPLLVTWF